MSLFNRNDKSGEAGPVAHTQAGQLEPAPAVKEIPVGQNKAVSQKIESVPSKQSSPTVPVSTPAQLKTGVVMASVISKALKITGELESTEDIQIDGQIDGDVRGVNVKIGQNAKVKGTVYGEEVELAGTVEGKIESKRVVLTSTAKMTGDIQHQDVKIDSGAYVCGSLKPESSKSDAKTSLKPASTAGSNALGSGAAAAH